MNSRTWSAIVTGFVLGFSATAGEVVINEIMYHPYHAASEAEDTGAEWIELFNSGTNAVSLQGWRLAKGVDYTFTNISLPAGGYLVVAASRSNFMTLHPGVTNVVGNWTGRLGNTDDELRLLNQAGEEVNRVAYADTGEWAVRARLSADGYGLRGWDWLAPHDGGGMTLELINPWMPNQYGQNWTASGPSGGTPGAANSALASNTAPLIQELAHFPLVPRSTESVTIRAQIIDEQTNGLTVTLFYRDASSASPPPFTSLPMYDDGAHGDNLAGDGLFTATIPAQANNAVVEFYVSATDAGGRNRTWPAPARNAPDLGDGVLPPESGANALYQVDDTPAYTGTQAFYRMIMTESERAFLASIQGSLRNSDAAANGTFVSRDANGIEEHHLTSYRRRGAGTRGANLPNYRVKFATDHRWKGVIAVNLNSQYTHAQIAGSVLAAMAGLNSEYQKPVQVRVNNVNLVSSGSPQFGSYAQQEVPDGDYAQNHFPEDSGGNVYRGSSGSHAATLAYLGTDPNAYINAGYSKTANGAEYDWSDLINLTYVLSSTPTSNYVAAVQARINVPQWMIYFAVFTLLDSKETSLGVGNGDDFGLYRGLLDTRFQLLGHDYDTILGQGDTAGNVNDSIFRATSVPAVDRLLKRPEFAPLYYRTLTNLMGSAFSPEQVGAALEFHLGSWVNSAVIASMKTFATNRNAAVLAQIPLAIAISNSLPVQNGYPRTTTSSASLSGTANAITTRSVLINGSAANWSAWNAQWSGTATLQPGINRVLVQALDETGREFERAYVDIWYDRSSVVNISSDIVVDTTWTAAAGPYNITAPINVVDEYTLRIQPGTTVYLAPGAKLTVNATGRLFAQGTETQHIRFGRNPAVTGNWGSVDFIGAVNDNRLAYVDFDSCGGTTLGGHNAQVHVNNSKVWFDHCSWPAAPAVEYISFDNSSFIVQNCVFPTYTGTTGPEMVHGVNGIPAGGYGIFRDNYFGHTWGYNDTIDFTGGNRPGAILQVIGNIFDGASDDHLDLDSTDAWIEGNIFMHAHRDPSRTDNPLDTASAISGGVDTVGQNSDWTIVNNLFFDVDHVLLNKGNSTTTGNGGGRVAFLYNTVVHVAPEYSGSQAAEIAVFDWSDNNVVLPDPAVGSGLYAAYNIIQDAPVLHRFYNPANLTVIMDNNILPETFKGTTNEWAGPGAGNTYVDARLKLEALGRTAISNVTAGQLQQAFQLRSGSPALGAAFGGRNIGGLNPPGMAIGGEPVGTTTATSAHLTVGPGGTFNWGTNASQPWGWTAFKWKLDGGAWSTPILVTNTSPFTNPPAIVLSNLSNGSHTVYVSGKSDAGYFQDDTFVYPTNASVPGLVTASRTWTVNTNEARLVINEVLARNVNTLVVSGKHPDLVELRNAGAQAVDLGDMSMTDDPAQPRKFVFPSGTTIPAGGYLVLYASGGEAAGHIYLGFALNDTGDGVYLYNKAASGGGLIDSVAFGLQLPDLSIGRLSDGSWGLTQPTFGSANQAQPMGEPSRLRINEWLAAAGTIFPADFIELFNTDPLPVALSGLGLSDAPMSTPLRSVIPPLSFIAGHGWQRFMADGEVGAEHLDFRLSADGGWIGLAQTNGVFIDIVVYSTQFPDVSQGRSPDGAANFVFFNQPTPGAGNPGQTMVITSTTTTMVPINQAWRMEASGTDLGASWRATNYDDSAWFSGPALFYNYDGGAGQVPPIPASSTIPFTNPKQTTVYFRTAFDYHGPTNGINFLLTQVIDDGCVLYLNNQEIYRFNFAAGVTVTYSSRPSLVSGGPPLLGGIPVTLGNLVQGTNYLAIEVHQQSASSSDIAMAVQLDAQQLTTNYLGTPVVLNEVFTKNQSFTNASGRTVDWVELYNPSTNLVDLSDLSLTDDPTQPRRWVFPPGATIGAGGYYVVEFDDSEPYSPFNAGFQLSADSGAVYLLHRPSAGGGLLDSVVYGVQVADLTLGRSVPGRNGTWTLCQPTREAANLPVALGSPAELKVNEWMANPANNDEDWFEVYNPGAQPVDLSGLHLTDDLSNPVKHTIRAFSYIGAGPEAWLKFIADSNPDKGGDHVNFKLANTEAIGIYTSDAVPTLIDAITYAGAQKGVSQGRLPDGGTNIVLFADSPTPEESNWRPLRESVVINEALARASSPLEQAIEIHNPNDADVAVGGWFLSNARKDLKRFLIPAGTIVPARGFRVFYEAEFNPGHDVPPSFALNAWKDDEIILSEADASGNLTGYRTSVQFGASAANVSFGRHETSTGEDFVAVSARTFGRDNPATVAEFRTGMGATNAYPAVGPIVINEIHYHPPEEGTNDNTLDEFIELLNTSASPVPLFDPAYPTNSWRLAKAVAYSFFTNLTVPAHDYLVVVSFDPATNAAALAAFRAKHGMGASAVIVGPWSGKLNNSSDAVELQKPDAPLLPPNPDAGQVPYVLVERVKYSDSAPWPTAADGNTNGVGLSLQRRSALDYGNDPVNWTAAVPTPGANNGTGASQPPAIVAAPADRVVTAGTDVALNVTATGAEPLTYQWRFNGTILPGETGAALLLPNVQSTNAGRYTVVVANPWGAAATGPARLTVQAPPRIAQEPQSCTVPEGEDATFVVTASGGALSYQWRFNGTDLTNATNATLTLTNVQLASAGGYDVRVANSFGATTSAVATLTVLVTPKILTQPESVAVIIGNSATFTVSASGTLPLAYRWQFNGASLAGATDSSLQLTNVQPGDAGDYTVVISNVAGSITSAVATLTVIVPPTVTVVASDAYAVEGSGNTGVFTFIRTSGASSNLTVRYTVSGSATAGSDYGALSGTITIPAGALSTNLLVTPLNDAVLEGDETVIATLTASTDYLIGSPSNAAVVIHDDDNAAPSITITAPTNSQLFLIAPTNIDIAVTTSDPNGSVAKVEFFVGGTNKLGESVSAPFGFTWTNAPAGSNVLTARATDNLGATTDSLPVTFIVNAPPIVGLVSPVNGATFGPPATITMQAVASDADGAVTQVCFYANNVLVGTDTNAPFSATIIGATAGAFVLRAVAWDDRGVSAGSAAVNVMVNPPGVFDDFEPDIDASQWSAFGDAANTQANNYGGSVSGSHSLWFGGDGPRSATTRPMDTSLGGTLSFQLRISNGSTSDRWESADLPGEGVVLEYSTDSGSTWVTLATFDTANANYTLGWTFEQFSIPGAAQAANTMFRWRQLSHSGACCDHWAIDDVQILVGPTPPIIATQPADQTAIVGGSASFSVSVYGSAPFGYQWRFNGTDIANATNAMFTFGPVSTNDAGYYSVVISNAYGLAISADARLAIMEANSEYFRIVALTTNNAVALDHYELTGYDPEGGNYGRGGVGVSGSQMFVNAGATAARFSAADLTGGTTLGTHYDALVTDLRTETVYCFGTNATGPARSSSVTSTLTHLLELNGNTGTLTGNAIPLSRPITLSGDYRDYAFFSGYGRVAVLAAGRVFHVAMPFGAVAEVGTLGYIQHSYSMCWAYWGLVEMTEDGLSLVYARDSQNIVRTHLPDGATTNLATFSNLGYYNPSLAFSVTRHRWYFDLSWNNQFSSGYQAAGFADAEFTLAGASNLPPAVLVAPQPVQALLGGRASFAVSAVGDGALSYQWRFNGENLPGAIAPGLVVPVVRPENLGEYSAVISNAFGAVTTAPVALVLAEPPAIVSQPQNQTVLAGNSVTFAVTNTGDGPFTYYWKFNGSDYATTTTNALVISYANFYLNGQFQVEVRNAVGGVTSSNATLLVLSPPFFNAQPSGHDTLRSMNTMLSATVDGTTPFRLQWYKDGAVLAGATNTTLTVTNAQPSDTAGYTVVATNLYGSVTSAVAVITVLELDEESFAIRQLGTNNAVTTDAYPLVYYVYQNGLAASAQRVFLNGYGNSGSGEAASFSAVDLSGGFALGAPRSGLVSDLRSRKVYSLADGTNLVSSSGGTISTLIELDSLTAQTTTNIVALSTNLSLTSYSAVFSGYGRVVLMDSSSRVYDVSLPSGQVQFLGYMDYFSYVYAYGFAYRGWGVAERIGTNTWLAHMRDSQTIERVRVPDGATETIASFTDLGYSGNFTVCLPRNRWYFNTEGSSQFGSGTQNTLVSAAASFVCLMPTNMVPAWLDQPVGKFARVGTSASFSGLAEGAAPLSYQWLFQGSPLANQTNTTLTVTNVRSAAEGSYSLVAINPAGMSTSAVATLTVDYGASSTNTVSLVALTGSTWRYNQTSAFYDSSWMAPHYDDSAWPTGSSVLAAENNSTINPYIQTYLTIGRTTYYFRTTFTVTTNFPVATMLRATTLIDDGAVIYLNGREVQRVRMSSGVNPYYSTLATDTPSGGDAAQEKFYWLAATNLVLGTNVLAAEVHQNTTSSSDIVWGMALDAQIPLLNRPATITNHPISQVVSNGTNVSFTVGATGTGPLIYQWRHAGTNLPGANKATLTITNVQRRHEGVYFARVTNPYDTVASSNAVLVVLAPPVQILSTSSHFTAPGQFTLQFLGDVGGRFAVETSTNLTAWTVAGTVTNVTGSAQFDDPTAGAIPVRFYRLRLLP